MSPTSGESEHQVKKNYKPVTGATKQRPNRQKKQPKYSRILNSGRKCDELSQSNPHEKVEVVFRLDN